MSQMIEQNTAEVVEAPQIHFDQKYITSSEICERLCVTRPAIHFRRKRGLLPGAIFPYGQQLVVWERATIEPHLAAWQEEIRKRTNGAATK